MKASPSLLLDTSVLLHLVNAKAPGKAIEAQFGLRSLDYQPLICSVTLGEMEAFARSRTWGASKRRAFAEVRSDLVVVDIGNQSVYDVYADFSTLARSNGWGIFGQKNDLWIAAATRVTGARLLTTDRDFLPLRDGSHLDVVVLDSKTGNRIP